MDVDTPKDDELSLLNSAFKSVIEKNLEFLKEQGVDTENIDYSKLTFTKTKKPKIDSPKYTTNAIISLFYSIKSDKSIPSTSLTKPKDSNFFKNHQI